MTLTCKNLAIEIKQLIKALLLVGIFLYSSTSLAGGTATYSADYRAVTLSNCVGPSTVSTVYVYFNPTTMYLTGTCALTSSAAASGKVGVTYVSNTEVTISTNAIAQAFWAGSFLWGIQATYNAILPLASQSITASATASSINVGATSTVSASAGSGTGAVTYSSSNTAVATVNSSTGVVTGVGAGSVTITATKAADSTYASATATTSITVTTTTPVLTFATPTSASVALGGALTNAATSSNYGGSYGAISYASSDTGVATVNSTSGAITTVAAGTAVITATQAAVAGVNAQATQTYTLTVQSTNAALSNLSLSSGVLSPIFASSSYAYSASVASATTSITVTPAVAQSNATVKVNGTTVTSGSASGSISLSAGSNTITTVVTAQDGMTTQTYTTTVTRAAASTATLSGLALSSGTLSPTFAIGTTSYTASVTNATSSMTVSPTLTDSNATVKVNGTTVASGSASSSIALSVGSNTITTVVTAQDGTTTQTYTTTVARAAALLAQSSFSVSASPSALNATTTTSTLSTTGGSGTGAVSYVMMSGTCSLSGTTVTAGTVNETCTVKATKAANSTYTEAAATVNITVSRRASLAAAATDASVAKTQGTQLMQTQKFVQTQLQNITSHLDTFRHTFNLAPSDKGVSVITPSLGPMTPLFYKVKDVWSGNTGESTTSSLHKVGMKDAELKNGSDKLYNDYNNPEEIDEQAAIEQRIYAYERKQETYSFWSAGTIDTGLFKSGDNKDVTNKFRVNGLTFGLDYKAGPRTIVGAALGVGQGSNTTQELDSKVKSTQQSFTGYGMLGFGDNWVVDGLLGYSRLSFTGDRTTSDGAATLSMNRTGDSTFASSSISKIFSFGALRVAPFLREDVTHIRLNQYNETGAADYALGYDTARYTATATSAGLHFSNDIYLDSGKLTTSAKLSANRMRTGSLSQDVYYADTGMAGGTYTLQQSSSYQNSRALSLGIMYSNKAGDGIDIGWMGAIGENQYKLNGLRFGARFAM